MLNETLEQLYLDKLKERYDEIGGLIYSNVTPIEGIELYETLAFERFEDASKAAGYRPIRPGESWGGDGKSGWFRMRFCLPESFAGKPAAAIIDVGYEGCAFIDGTPYQGVDRWHEEVLLADRSEAGKSCELYVEATSGAFWQGQTEPARFKRAGIATINREVASYWYALGFLVELASALPQGSVRRARLIRGLNESVNEFDCDRTDEESLRESAERALCALRPILDQKAEPSALQFTCCGHAHIDTAWLWPYAETIRKCSRSFSSVVRLMEQYPDYHFSQSQPQLYEFAKEHYPRLYEEIRKRVREGRWEPIGCMWVEADTNIPSGESLIRQIIFGRRFIKEEFGVDTDVLWLPDVFGYSAALPQILKKSGVDYFTTVKLIWGNQFNQIPYSSFWWQGIDGSRVLAHFPPHGDYNTQILPEPLRRAQESYKEKDRSSHVLLQYGWGDGGGGPSKAHLEHLKLAKDLEGLPRCVQGRGHDFFQKLRAEADSFPTWQGELYFELHRGTYTTQARTKWNNRKAELALRDAEMLSTAAMVLGAPYPADDLARAWKLVLKNQFHDVIPGSSVPVVYKDAEEDYKQVFSLVKNAAARAEAFIADRMDTSGPGMPIVVFNTLSWARDDAALVTLPDTASYSVLDASGAPVPSQISKDGQTLYFTAHAPPLGAAVYRLVRGAAPEVEPGVTVSPTLLENRFFRIELDDRALITSIHDKAAGREVVPDGEAANVFQLFEDKPCAWDAWDIDFFYREKGWEISDIESIEVEELGPVVGALRLTRRFGSSSVEQWIVIYAESPRLDFVTKVDWHEKQKLLKVAFPVTINSPTARYEIQFGNLERPTHWNTSWDFAKFEVCGHKWADLAEGGYGVSLLNDCKYGYDIHENVMRLTLLRSTTAPDPTADRGEQFFTYSLYPHQGDYAASGTVRAAYELNVPLRVLLTSAHTGAVPPRASLFNLNADNMVLDTVKKAEDDECIVLRFYEAHNKRGRVSLSTELPVRQAWECDLLERNLGRIDVREGVISFDIVPFEIKTVKLALG